MNKQTKPQEQPNPTSSLETTFNEAPTRASELSQHKLFARTELRARTRLRPVPRRQGRHAQVPCRPRRPPGPRQGSLRRSSQPAPEAAAAAQAGHRGVSRRTARAGPASGGCPPPAPTLPLSRGSHVLDKALVRLESSFFLPPLTAMAAGGYRRVRRVARRPRGPRRCPGAAGGAARAGER